VKVEPEALRVLVVDDSAFTRRSIADMLAGSPGIEIVGKAADGEEALRLISVYKPDVITLDLEMPRMDGFTFLRILMSSHPLPVIVVSSYGQKENVFRALELGALDFVVKPDRRADAEMVGIQQQLREKLSVARRVRRLGPSALVESPQSVAFDVAQAQERGIPGRLIAIASSTGGPTALLTVLSALPMDFPHALLIAQHMPDRFTKTFAERLDRRTHLRVKEAEDGDLVLAGMALVCPGRRCMEVECVTGSPPIARVMVPHPEDRYQPNADRLLISVAQAYRERSVGMVLTGMGDDGARGVQAISKVGGKVVAESVVTAVVFGMPGAAERTGCVDEMLAITELGPYLRRLPR
jgi:two-component system chemotaxis response regulator CheB